MGKEDVQVSYVVDLEYLVNGYLVLRMYLYGVGPLLY
jgi:hypothetical protein